MPIIRYNIQEETSSPPTHSYNLRPRHHHPPTTVAITKQPSRSLRVPKHRPTTTIAVPHNKVISSSLNHLSSCHNLIPPHIQQSQYSNNRHLFTQYQEQIPRPKPLAAYTFTDFITRKQTIVVLLAQLFLLVLSEFVRIDRLGYTLGLSLCVTIGASLGFLCFFYIPFENWVTYEWCPRPIRIFAAKCTSLQFHSKHYSAAPRVAYLTHAIKLFSFVLHYAIILINSLYYSLKYVGTHLYNIIRTLRVPNVRMHKMAPMTRSQTKAISDDPAAASPEFRSLPRSTRRPNRSTMEEPTNPLTPDITQEEAEPSAMAERRHLPLVRSARGTSPSYPTGTNQLSENTQLLRAVPHANPPTHSDLAHIGRRLDDVVACIQSQQGALIEMRADMNATRQQQQQQQQFPPTITYPRVSEITDIAPPHALSPAHSTSHPPLIGNSAHPTISLPELQPLISAANVFLQEQISNPRRRQ